MFVEGSAGRIISSRSEDGTVDAIDSGGWALAAQGESETQHIGAAGQIVSDVKVRHPDVATKVVRGFSHAQSQCCKAVSDAVSRLQAVGLKVGNVNHEANDDSQNA